MRGNTIQMKLLKGAMNRSLPLYQYDYGQVLILTGVTLPSAYEVHFSNTEHGNSKTSIGNEDGVVIPDEFLTSGEDVYVWLFLHDGLTDGETEFKGIIPVHKRAKPTNQPPTPVQQDVITQTIAALNEGVSQVEADVGHYPKVIDGYWYTWDETAHEWVNTGDKAQGEQGIQGETGATGATPNLTVGTVQTGEPGTDAEVTITGTPENPVLNFTIPQGADGDLSSSDVATIAQTTAMLDDYFGGE